MGCCRCVAWWRALWRYVPSPRSYFAMLKDGWEHYRPSSSSLISSPTATIPPSSKYTLSASRPTPQVRHLRFQQRLPLQDPQVLRPPYRPSPSGSSVNAESQQTIEDAATPFSQLSSHRFTSNSHPPAVFFCWRVCLHTHTNLNNIITFLPSRPPIKQDRLQKTVAPIHPARRAPLSADA